MTESEIGLGVGLVTVVLTVIGMTVRTTRAISATELDIRKDMTTQAESLQQDIGGLKFEGSQRAESIRQETGEMGSALRTKIHEVETWSRDTFVRRDSFEMVVGRLEKSIEKMTDRLEEKFDKAIERAQRRPAE